MISFLSLVFMLSYVSVGNNSFPQPLSAAEESELLIQFENGSEEAKNTLIERNLRLVAHVAKKYSSDSRDIEDLISIGTIGIIKAINSYKRDKNVRLATYAAKCIENEILMSIRNEKKHSSDVYLQDPIGKDKEGNEMVMMDTLAVETDDFADKINTKMQIEKMYDKIQSSLLDREKLIIKLRYGLWGTDELTQREIAKMLGISRSYVSRIEKKALLKLEEGIKD